MDILKEFAPETARLMKRLYENGWEDMRMYPRGRDVVTEFYGSDVWQCYLVLKDAEGCPADLAELSLSERNLAREGEWYVLSGTVWDYESEEERSVAIRFRDAEAKVEVYRAGSAEVESEPWELLRAIAGNILSKAEFCGLNTAEEAALPLLRELAILSKLNVFGEWEGLTGLTELKGYLRRYGHDRTVKLAGAVETVFGKERARQRRIRRLLKELDRAVYEPVWRAIHADVLATQTEYPERTACDPGTERLRLEITELLDAQGYSGTYPDFVKRGEVRGLRLEESRGEPYFICNEKNAVFRIHCTEHWFDGELMLFFQCGTELLREGEAAGDLHSCRFDAKGRRFFHTVLFEAEYSEDLTLHVNAAVKKAELRKLSKAERKADVDIHGLSAALLVFLLGGGLFAVWMTAGMAAVTAVMTLIFAGAEAIPGILTDLPWWKLFAGCWVGFGGLMGLVTAWALK